MKDYRNIENYLEKLSGDVYPQPPDLGHIRWTVEALRILVPMIKDDTKTVLDLGCGEGFCEWIFKNYGIDYIGIAQGEDVKNAQDAGRNVIWGDFSFLSQIKDNSFDLLFSRHSLEHSPMPLITLMEWNRVTRKYLIVILPDPEYWGFAGVNHYYVLNEPQWENLFDVSGFRVLYRGENWKAMGKENEPISNIEFWYLLEKK